jgi:hypothetical protein
MYSDTIAVLEKFDNSHEFERMCAAILIAQGYREVVLMAPRGGPDEGQDITFRIGDGSKGVACCTIRKDIDDKFREDFSKRKPGEYTQYILFCTAYLTFEQKKKFNVYCLNNLDALFLPQDIEVLRGLLDNAHQDIRERFLHIPDQSKLRQQETLSIVSKHLEAKDLFNQAKQAMAQYDWGNAEYYMDAALELFPLAEAPSYFGRQLSAALTESFKREHDIPPGYKLHAFMYDRQSKRSFFVPSRERALYWLERARKQNEKEVEKVAAVEVLRELALMYGLSKNYDEMLVCMEEAISLSAIPAREFFKKPSHLAMLAHGCVDEPDQAEALQKLGMEMKLRLPVSLQIVQQNIIESGFSTCWIVLGKEDAWIREPKKPGFPIPLSIKLDAPEGTEARIVLYPKPDGNGRNAVIPSDEKAVPLNELINQLADKFLFICHQPANPQYKS